MLMFRKSNKDNGEKIFRYSIRKYHFGAASVAVAALMFFANGVQAQAPEVSLATASEMVAGSAGNSDGDPQESDEGELKKTVIEQPAEGESAGELKAQGAKAEEANQGQGLDKSKSAPGGQEGPQVGEIKEREGSTPTADKTAAKSTQGTLEALLEKLTLSSMKALHDEVESRLATAKAVLDDPNATQEQVDEQVKLMEDLTRRVKEALSPQVSTPPVLEKAGLTNHGLAAPEGAVLTPKEAVTKALEENHVSSTNGEVSTPSTELSKPEVSDNQNKDKLKTLSRDLSAYLIQANEITRPETKKLLEGVEEVVKSIEASVSQPQLTPTEIEELLKKGKQAEKKLFLAISRENSGKRDLRNGSRMARGADFRANTTGLDTKRAYIVQDGDGSELPAETYLYAMQRAINSNPDSNNIVPVRDVLGRATMLVKNNGNGKYTWTVTFNKGNNGGTNDFYWFTLPKGHRITKTLAITRTYNGRNSSIGGVDFNKEWRSDGEIKSIIGEGKRAVHGPAEGPFHFNTKFDSLRDVTNSLINPKVAGDSHYDTEDPANYSNKDKYYYLGELSHRYIPRPISGTAVPQDVRDKAARNIAGIHANTEHLYHFTLDNGTITITYETQADKPDAPLYYAAGMRTIEHNVAKMYFMARGLQEKPKAPTVTSSDEGTVTVTPYQNSDSDQNKNVDKVELSYTNARGESKTATLKRDAGNGTWSSNDTEIKVLGNSFIVKQGTAKVGTPVKAKSYYGNSDPSDERQVPVPTAIPQNKKYNPTAKNPQQEVSHNQEADPEKSVDKTKLPADTRLAWKDNHKPDTSHPGNQTGIVVVTYPDGTSEDVTVTVKVKEQKDEYQPTPTPRPDNGGNTDNSGNSNNGGTTTPADSNSNSVTPDNSANTPAQEPSVSPSAPAHSGDSMNQATGQSTQQRETGNATEAESSRGLSGSSVTDPARSRRSVAFAGGAQSSQEKQVDKSVLRDLIQELETRLKDLDGIDQSVINAAKIILGEGQEALRNTDLTEAGLREITAKVKEALESLKGKQTTKDEEETKETRKEQGHLPYGTMIASLLALLGLLLFLIARRKKESELKKLTKELTKVLQESDLTNVDAKALDQAREALAQAVAFLANEKESDHTEEELIEKLKAILAQLR